MWTNQKHPSSLIKSFSKTALKIGFFEINYIELNVVLINLLVYGSSKAWEFYSRESK